MLGNFSCFPCRLLTFQKNISETLSQVSNCLDPDQGQHSVSPDLGTNCLQKLSAGDRSPLARRELKHLIGLPGALMSVSDPRL